MCVYLRRSLPTLVGAAAHISALWGMHGASEIETSSHSSSFHESFHIHWCHSYPPLSPFHSLPSPTFPPSLPPPLPPSLPPSLPSSLPIPSLPIPSLPPLFLLSLSLPPPSLFPPSLPSSLPSSSSLHSSLPPPPVNEDWYEGQCNGGTGIFPRSYIRDT